MRDYGDNKLTRYEFVRHVSFCRRIVKKLFEQLNTQVLMQKKNHHKLDVNYNLKKINIQF